MLDFFHFINPAKSKTGFISPSLLHAKTKIYSLHQSCTRNLRTAPIFSLVSPVLQPTFLLGTKGWEHHHLFRTRQINAIPSPVSENSTLLTATKNPLPNTFLWVLRVGSDSGASGP
ncbi:hypothetical protein CEXT_803451 [Caerostris extrusa]|uniref:Uncharacterized protein n=1 Tax=Caerostris extrusa TaxID=172846 RepID=A0AAV4TAL6_CAEEX|nr:hypothetical protein CEXT_803451 [Caerostris extrusa]